MEDFFEMMKALFIGACATAVIVVIIYFCFYSCESAHVNTESSPSLFVDFKDIQYKGHTYIMVDATYSHTIVHAAHCKCHSVKY